jgi:hypothetical protein
MPKKSSDGRTKATTQRTKKGLEIPVPTRDEFEEALRKAATRTSSGKRAKPSRSG